jgi:hypothetical protein
LKGAKAAAVLFMLVHACIYAGASRPVGFCRDKCGVGRVLLKGLYCSLLVEGAACLTVQNSTPYMNVVVGVCAEVNRLRQQPGRGRGAQGHRPLVTHALSSLKSTQELQSGLGSHSLTQAAATCSSAEDSLPALQAD